MHLSRISSVLAILFSVLGAPLHFGSSTHGKVAAGTTRSLGLDTQGENGENRILVKRQDANSEMILEVLRSISPVLLRYPFHINKISSCIAKISIVIHRLAYGV